MGGRVAMGLANCKECGKLYMQTAAGLCPDCYRIEEENEGKVAHYLQDHSRASINEVHEATQVSEKTILKMIKKGRITGDVELSYPCESCGKPIVEGRVCQDCGRRVLGQIRQEPKPTPQPQSTKRPGEGMHTTFNKR